MYLPETPFMRDDAWENVLRVFYDGAFCVLSEKTFLNLV